MKKQTGPGTTYKSPFRSPNMLRFSFFSDPSITWSILILLVKSQVRLHKLDKLVQSIWDIFANNRSSKKAKTMGGTDVACNTDELKRRLDGHGQKKGGRKPDLTETVKGLFDVNIQCGPQGGWGKIVLNKS